MCDLDDLTFSFHFPCNNKILSIKMVELKDMK